MKFTYNLASEKSKSQYLFGKRPFLNTRVGKIVGDRLGLTDGVLVGFTVGVAVVGVLVGDFVLTGASNVSTTKTN